MHLESQIPSQIARSHIQAAEPSGGSWRFGRTGEEDDNGDGRQGVDLMPAIELQTEEATAADSAARPKRTGRPRKTAQPLGLSAEDEGVEGTTATSKKSRAKKSKPSSKAAAAKEKVETESQAAVEAASVWESTTEEDQPRSGIMIEAEWAEVQSSQAAFESSSEASVVSLVLSGQAASAEESGQTRRDVCIAPARLDGLLSISPPLRDYQAEAIRNVVDSLRQGVRRQLISMPTGSGKTIMFVSLARLLDCRTLILVHRDTLVEQTLAALGR